MGLLGTALGVAPEKQVRIQQKVATDAAMKMIGGWKGMMKMAKMLRKLDASALEKVMKDPNAAMDDPALKEALEGVMDDPEIQKMMMSQMQEALKDPKVQKQLEESMKDPEVQRQMQEAMKDP